MRRHLRLLVTTIATAGLIAAGVGFTATGSYADTSGTGWVRIGHFSPNTGPVDVRITALAGGSTLFSLTDVRFGQVSNYLAMEPGSYVVSMRPGTAPGSAKPIISQSFTVKAGGATTVAAYGPNAKLKTAVFTDSLTAPAPGQARIRLIQVSTQHPKLTLRTSTGQLLAKDAVAGTATGYASVPAGEWALSISGSGADASAPISLAGGSVDTVLVLDNATGGVSVRTLVDSASGGPTPAGGVQTGGGFLAEHGGDTNLVPSRHQGR